MSLSMHGETLFHFTNELPTLLRILEDSHFKASFSLESLSFQSPQGAESIPGLWVPMVSFCDYKLSEIGHHVLNYGSYGLGMSKAWGIAKGLNPVLYVSAQSQIGAKLKSVLNKIAVAKQMGDPDCALGDTDIEVANMFAWTKNYQGTLIRKGDRTPGFRYADDKEWRYVAEIDYSKFGEIGAPFGRGYSFITRPDVDCPNCKMPAQLCIEGGARILKEKQAEYSCLIDQEMSSLAFDSSDVRFILVKSAADRKNVVCWIANQIGWGAHQKLQMASKIIAIDDLDLRKLAPVHSTEAGN